MIAEPLRLFMALSEAPEMKNKWGQAVVARGLPQEEAILVKLGAWPCLGIS